jgi:hypothetical protein
MNARTTAARTAERPGAHAQIIAALLDQAAPERRLSPSGSSRRPTCGRTDAGTGAAPAT